MPKGVNEDSDNGRSTSRTTKLKTSNQPNNNEKDNDNLSLNNSDNQNERLSKDNLRKLSEKNNQYKNREKVTDEESEIGSGSTKTKPDSDLNLFVEDVRDSIKEKILSDSSSQILPGSSLQKDKRTPKFIQSIDNWMYGKIRNPFSPYKHVVGSTKKKRSPIRIIILISLLVILGYVLVIAGRMLTQMTPVVVPTKTPIPTYSIPTPYSVQFPGGWTFILGTSNVEFEDWNPVQAEWFKDTAICKLIAIPWSKQIDAVYKTLVPGEQLFLTMSNEDEAIYVIETLETAQVKNIISRLNRNSPCMIIYLYRESTSTAQLIMSVPPTP